MGFAFREAKMDMADGLMFAGSGGRVGQALEATEKAGVMANARALGAAGEEAVGITGAKEGVLINGKMRFPDRLTTRTLEEVKNVKSQSFTQQLRDYLQFSKRN